jgi:hypothetical protein
VRAGQCLSTLMQRPERDVTSVSTFSVIRYAARPGPIIYLLPSHTSGRLLGPGFQTEQLLPRARTGLEGARNTTEGHAFRSDTFTITLKTCPRFSVLVNQDSAPSTLFLYGAAACTVVEAISLRICCILLAWLTEGKTRPARQISLRYCLRNRYPRVS